MAHPLDGAFARIERAGQHIDDLSARFIEFRDAEVKALTNKFNAGAPDNPYVKVLRGERVEVSIPPALFGILVGETVYNLRAALDYLIYALAELDSGKPQDGTQFPIDSSETKFRTRTDTKQKRGCFLRGVNPGHVAQIERLQPYNGVEWTRQIAAISNPDKHRQLVSVITQPKVSVWLTPRGRRRPVAAAELTTNVLGVGADLDVYTRTRFDIRFVDDAPVIETLQPLKVFVNQTLETFTQDF